MNIGSNVVLSVKVLPVVTVVPCSQVPVLVVIYCLFFAWITNKLFVVNKTTEFIPFGQLLKKYRFAYRNIID
jgi:hypothetical protein